MEFIKPFIDFLSAHSIARYMTFFLIVYLCIYILVLIISAGNSSIKTLPSQPISNVKKKPSKPSEDKPSISILKKKTQKMDTKKSNQENKDPQNNTGKNIFNGGHATFNAPVNNGDTYNEIKIKDQDLKLMLDFLENKVRETHAEKKFNIHIKNNSDASNNAMQIITYLKANGFTPVEIISELGLYSDGIQIEFANSTFIINVGHYIPLNN